MLNHKLCPSDHCNATLYSPASCVTLHTPKRCSRNGNSSDQGIGAQSRADGENPDLLFFH
ncbi:hypothetical protein M3J09_000096 [Ascochyta lentis]